jgi:hypothetical protein
MSMRTSASDFSIVFKMKFLSGEKQKNEELLPSENFKFPSDRKVFGFIDSCYYHEKL